MKTALATLSTLLFFGNASAQPASRPGDESGLAELVVYARAQTLIGISQAASEGIVGYADLSLPPLLRPGELVEAIPGMVATQHSGTGKANQYFIRGFNLDHGTDFAAFVEGVPINMRSHGHGQGYLDLNFLIPEIVETTSYRRGPYSVAVGDFSSAASIEFDYYYKLPENTVTATVGENNYYRALTAGSRDAGSGVLTGAIGFTSYDGPWELEENLKRYKFHGAYGVEYGAVRARFTMDGYDSQWDATDQIPQRAVTSGRLSRLGFIDPDLGGETKRYALAGSLDFGKWSLNGYAIDYDFSLYSNFTYFLDDLNAGIAYLTGNAEYRLDVFNILDSDDNEIAYYYESRLANESDNGTRDIHFHPLEPRTIRASVTVRFSSAMPD